jgi:hypothetical protein
MRSGWLQIGVTIRRLRLRQAAIEIEAASHEADSIKLTSTPMYFSGCAIFAMFNQLTGPPY